MQQGINSPFSCDLRREGATSYCSYLTVAKTLNIAITTMSKAEKSVPLEAIEEIIFAFFSF